MTVTVTPKTVTLANWTANDATVVDQIHTDLYNNDNTLASYINAHVALFDGPNTFSDTNTFTSKPISTKGINLAQASEPTSPTIGDYWYSSTNNAFEGLVQLATVSGATNASPIVVTTGAAHGLVTGQTVYISGVVGNTAANGSFVVTVTGTTTFSLNGSTGNGAYTSGGTVSRLETVLTSPKYPLPLTVVSRSSNTILGISDMGKVFTLTSTGGFTQTLTAAATLGSGWYCYIRNDSTGIDSIDPNGSETIDGETLILVNPGDSFILYCDGSNFKTIGRNAVANINDQTITSAGTLTIAHNLTKIPLNLSAYLVCQTGEGGYSTGDVVSYQFSGDGAPATTGFGASLWADATNVYVQYASAGFKIPKRSATVGDQFTITNGNWRLRIRAKLT